MSEKKRVAVILGVTLAVWMGIRFLLPYVLPFFIAWLLVRMLNPLVSAVCRRIRIKREAAGAVILTRFFLLAGPVCRRV